MAKEIKLTRGYVALVDDEDYEKVSQLKGRPNLSKRADGTVRDVYARGRLPERKDVKLHRFVLGLTDPKVIVDHINHNGLDCRKENLRITDCSGNGANRVLSVNNTSGFKGVHWYARKALWHVFVYFRQKPVHVGYFSDHKEAAKAYDSKAVELFGEFALTNAGMGLLD